MTRRKPNTLRRSSKIKTKLGDKKPNKEYERPKKPNNLTFCKTAKETKLEQIKQELIHKKRNPDKQTINWDSPKSTTNKLQPLGGVFQTKTVVTKTGPYAPMSVRRYKRWSRD